MSALKHYHIAKLTGHHDEYNNSHVTSCAGSVYSRTQQCLEETSKFGGWDIWIYYIIYHMSQHWEGSENFGGISPIAKTDFKLK